MPMFGSLNQNITVGQLQSKFAALFNALEALEDAYQWSAAYSLSDFEDPPLNLPTADAQAILNALADFHDLYMTGQGADGFPLPQLPYNFFASMRMITGAR